MSILFLTNYWITNF